MLLIAFVVCSCDGHVRSFKPPQSAGLTSGQAALDESIRLVTAIDHVGREHGFSYDIPNQESPDYHVAALYYKKIGNGSLQIKLLRDNATGEYRITLLDWPGSTRSEESVAIEAELLRSLQTPIASAP